MRAVEDMQEVLLIGFYDDSVFAPFIKDASRDFPNLTIRCAVFLALTRAWKAERR